MTRKLLSGVLAFAMVFGCTAPVALAEETVEEIEQEALVDYELDKSTVKFEPGDTTTQIVNLGGWKNAKDISVSVRGDDGKFTVADYMKVGGYLLVSPKTNAVAGDTAEVTITITHEATNSTISTITRKLTLKVNETAQSDTWYELTDKSMTVAKGASNSITLEQAGIDTNGEPIAYRVKITNAVVSNNANGAVEVSYTGNKLTVTGKKEIAAAPVQVTYVNVKGETKTIIVTVEVAPERDMAYEWVKKSTSVKADTSADYIVQAYRFDEFGNKQPCDTTGYVEWYVNDMLVTNANNFVGTYTNSDGKVALKIKENNDYSYKAARTIEFYLPGVYTITMKAANTENVLLSTTVTVGVADVEEVIVTQAPLAWGGYVQLGRTYGISDIAGIKLHTVINGTDYYLGDGTDNGKDIIDPNYTLKVELDSSTATAAEKDTFAAATSVDMAAGTITFANTEAMQKMAEKSYTFKVTVTAASGKKDAISGIKFSKFAVGDEKAITIQVAGKNAADPYVIKTGETVDFDAIVKDVASNSAVGNDQTVVWSIEYTSINGMLDAVTGKKYATVDQNGKVTALAPTAGKIAVVATSAKYVNVYGSYTEPVTAKIYLSIVGEVPTEKPTEAPTQAPTVTGKVVTSSSALNIRAAATTASGIVTKAAKGSIVTILGEENGFYKVQLADGTVGYASKAYIEIITADEPVVTATATTTANLRLRTSAPSGSVITTMPKGATVTVLEKGASWSKVEYNGKVGYASNDYLTFNTVG
ncbi:MAG: SH3 domain-containing protein [Candidatus Fimadaptatus sp.]